MTCAGHSWQGRFRDRNVTTVRWPLWPLITTDWPARRTSVMSDWSRERLKRLFDSLAERLWPGQLTDWRVETRFFIPTKNCVGCCLDADKTIVLDLSRIRTVRYLRGVLLHEMCHAATPDSRGHDLQFFQQVERLLGMGLRPAINFRWYLDEPDGETVFATLSRCATLRNRCERRLGIATQCVFPEFIEFSPFSCIPNLSP